MWHPCAFMPTHDCHWYPYKLYMVKFNLYQLKEYGLVFQKKNFNNFEDCFETNLVIFLIYE